MTPREGVVAQLVERIRVLQGRVRVLEGSVQDLLDELEIYRSLAEPTEEVDCPPMTVDRPAADWKPFPVDGRPLSAFQLAALDVVRGAR